MFCSPVASAKAEPTVEALPRRSAEWIPATVPECGIVADFPGVPKRMEETPKQLPKVVLLQLELANNQGVYQLGCATVPRTSQPARVLLDGARDGTLKSVNATLVRETEILGGREVVFELQGQQGVTRLFLAGDKLVTALVAPLGSVGSDNARRFLTSVQMGIGR